MKILAYVAEPKTFDGVYLVFSLTRINPDSLAWVFEEWASHKMIQEGGYIRLSRDSRLTTRDEKWGYIIPFQEGDLQ